MEIRLITNDCVDKIGHAHCGDSEQRRSAVYLSYMYVEHHLLTTTA